MQYRISGYFRGMQFSQILRFSCSFAKIKSANSRLYRKSHGRTHWNREIKIRKYNFCFHSRNLNPSKITTYTVLECWVNTAWYFKVRFIWALWLTVMFFLCLIILRFPLLNCPSFTVVYLYLQVIFWVLNLHHCMWNIQKDERESEMNGGKKEKCEGGKGRERKEGGREAWMFCYCMNIRLPMFPIPYLVWWQYKSQHRMAQIYTTFSLSSTV